MQGRNQTELQRDVLRTGQSLVLVTDTCKLMNTQQSNQISIIVIDFGSTLLRAEWKTPLKCKNLNNIKSSTRTCSYKYTTYVQVQTRSQAETIREVWTVRDRERNVTLLDQDRFVVSDGLSLVDLLLPQLGYLLFLSLLLLSSLLLLHEVPESLLLADQSLVLLTLSGASLRRQLKVLRGCGGAAALMT